jgi:transposase
MARVPTIAEEDAKRPNRERECLVGERTRIVNRIKATLARLGIRNFKPTLRKAAERLATVHTPEGMPLPPNAVASCSATWHGWALLSARSGRSRKLVRND